VIYREANKREMNG